MRAYLLGTLTPEQAAVIEERYFVDRASLLHLEQVEQALIADYLAGRLSLSERDLFAQRYLENTVLAQKVEAARALQPTAPIRSSFGWSPAGLATAAAFVVAISGAVVYSYRTSTGAAVEPPAIVARAIPPAELTLSPGITKGPKERKQSQIQAPLPASGLRLRLELPGPSSPSYCRVNLSRIAPDGRRDSIWSSPQPHPAAVGSDGRQYVVVNLASSLLSPGDYLVELINPQASIFETYLFRVITSR